MITDICLVYDCKQEVRQSNDLCNDHCIERFDLTKKLHESDPSKKVWECHIGATVIMEQPERSKREDSHLCEMRCSEHCGNTVRDK